MVDATREFYEQHARDYEENTYELCPRAWLNAFLQHIPEGGRILDLGCAYGRDSGIFVEQGYQVVGVDYSEALITRAIERVPKGTFLVQNVLDLHLLACYEPYERKNNQVVARL